MTTSASKKRFGDAVRNAFGCNRVARILIEAPGIEAGPFDGGCRVVARALMRIVPGGRVISVDREAYPGGCMAGFILWMGARIREWAADKGLHPGERALWFGPGWDAWEGKGDPRKAFLCPSKADPRHLDPKTGILESFDNWLTRWVTEHGKGPRCESRTTCLRC